MYPNGKFELITSSGIVNELLPPITYPMVPHEQDTVPTCPKMQFSNDKNVYM